MHGTRIKLLFASLMVATIAACGGPSALRCQPGETRQFHDLLYFGTAIGSPPVAEVSETQWQGFVDEVLSRHFADGLTVIPAAGQWKPAAGVPLRERSYVLSLVHSGSPEVESSISAAIDHYKRAFDQESVLRVRSPACVAFR